MPPISILKKTGVNLDNLLVLDLGAGNGKIAKAVQKLGAKVDLVDKNTDLKKEFPENFIKKDLLEFKTSHKYDLVLLWNVSWFLPVSTNDLLNHLFSFLKNDGLLLINFLGEKDSWYSKYSFYPKPIQEVKEYLTKNSIKLFIAQLNFL